MNIDLCELDNLRKKLELTRLPISTAEGQWGEVNGVSLAFMNETVEHWLHGYDWKKEQSRINRLPQFKAKIDSIEFGVFDIHFVHARCPEETGKNAIPLLFLHGWPGNFTEVTKILEPLQSAGYHVVAPSLPG